MEFYCRGKEVLDENHVRFGASGLPKKIFKRPKSASKIVFFIIAEKSC